MNKVFRLTPKTNWRRSVLTFSRKKHVTHHIMDHINVSVAE